jgi:hypothetical protein
LHATSFSFGAEVATIQTITSSQSGRRA